MITTFSLTDGLCNQTGLKTTSLDAREQTIYPHTSTYEYLSRWVHLPGILQWVEGRKPPLFTEPEACILQVSYKQFLTELYNFWFKFAIPFAALAKYIISKVRNNGSLQVKTRL